MTNHKLLSGNVVQLEGLTSEEAKFLEELQADAGRKDADYFELLRRVKGPDAVPLRGGRITPEVSRSALYLAAHDIVDRIGIEQGYVLAPDIKVEVPEDRALLSLTEAAELIGISRPATHQALVEKRLVGWRVGNAWVVDKVDAERFVREKRKRSRSQPRKERNTNSKAIEV